MAVETPPDKPQYTPELFETPTGNPVSTEKLSLIARLNRAIYRQAPEVFESIKSLPYNLYKSIYRTTAFPKTERERSEAFFNSFLLHIQPAKIEKNALRFTYTFGLGLM